VKRSKFTDEQIAFAKRATPRTPMLSPMTPCSPGLEHMLRERLGGFDVRPQDRKGHRRAAVAVAVTEQGHGADLAGLPQHSHWSDAPALLVTRRAKTLSSHAGQWALPGGRIDTGETPEAAALRELREEVNLVLDGSAVLGRLDDYSTRSGYVITPVVVWAAAAREAVPQEAEVASRASCVADAGGRELDCSTNGGFPVPVPRGLPARPAHAGRAFRPAILCVEVGFPLRPSSFRFEADRESSHRGRSPCRHRVAPADAARACDPGHGGRPATATWDPLEVGAGSEGDRQAFQTVRNDSATCPINRLTIRVQGMCV